jgi:hypothetical protein
MNPFPTEQLNDLLAGTYQPEADELGKTMAATLLSLNERLETIEAVRQVQSELIASSLQRIALAEGEVLHVKSPKVLGKATLEHIHQHIKPFFPNNRIIVSDAETMIDMSVIHPQKPETPEKGSEV